MGAEAEPIKAFPSVISIIESLVLFLPCVLQVSLELLHYLTVLLVQCATGLRPLCKGDCLGLQGFYLVSIRCSEKATATHSSTLAWKIPWTEEPGRLQSTGSQSRTSLSLFTFMHWRRKWQPTPVFLPGESQGRGSLVGCCLWGHTELDATEVT